jgi:hypothetical protein
MHAFGKLLEAVKVYGLFKRNKVSLEKKVWAIVLYLAGLSLRAITERYGLVNLPKVSSKKTIHLLGKVN